MANYATLKAAIQNVIKTNGNNEITGALLQQSLLAMITALGDKYQFAGIADTNTTPGTPDQNVFYIATTPGDYSNFGTGVGLYPGEIAVFVYNGSWSKIRTSIGSNAQVIKVVGKGTSSTAAGITGVGQVFYNTNSQLFRICIEYNPPSNIFETIYPTENTIFVYNNDICLWNGSDFVPLYNVNAITAYQNLLKDNIFKDVTNFELGYYNINGDYVSAKQSASVVYCMKLSVVAGQTFDVLVCGSAVNSRNWALCDSNGLIYEKNTGYYPDYFSGIIRAKKDGFLVLNNYSDGLTQLGLTAHVYQYGGIFTDLGISVNQIEQIGETTDNLNRIVLGGGDIPYIFRNNQINSSNLWVSVAQPNGGRLYNINPKHTYRIAAKTNVATIIAVLQNIDNTSLVATPAFSSQYQSRIVIAANGEFAFTCPDDAFYLYMVDQPNSTTYDAGTITERGICEDLGEIKELQQDVEQIGADVDLAVTGNQYSKSQMSQFEDMGAYLLDATNSIGKTYQQVTKVTATAPAHIYKIPLNGKAVIKYPVFLTSGGYGCLVADANDTIIAQYANSTLASGTLKTINTPANAAYFYFSAPSSISSLSDYQVTIKQATGGSVDTAEIDNLLVAARVCWLPFLSNLTDTNKNSLNLAGIRFDYVTNKMPFQRGYLFHKNNPDDNTIFYGTKLDNAQQVGILDYLPSRCVIGVSSKDGTVIGVGRDTRAAIHVFQNGQNYTVNAKSSDGNNTSPKGWLYNSGCEFIPDGTNEYCIFAEYDGTVSDNQRLYIWKGTYPYTSPSDWKTVYYKTTSFNSGHPTAGSITHWHMIRRDPWTGIIYCTSGDFTGQFFWIYSTDNGETWNELASDSNAATKPSWVLDGQPLRCINFIFTKDYIYFATDHGSNNTLSRIQRASNGLIDLTTREILATLPYGIAVNSLCYVESPNGLFMFTRIDTGFSAVYDKDIPVLFWSFLNEKMYTVAKLKQLVANWGGHRGKCYFNYTNGQETRPAMGFAANTPCGFDLIGADGTAIGTIFYTL